MKQRYLEVTFRKGQPIAAYLYLPRGNDVRVKLSKPVTSGMIVDFDANGTPIGLEITAPAAISLQEVNRVMVELGLGEVDAIELKPLLAA